MARGSRSTEGLATQHLGFRLVRRFVLRVVSGPSKGMIHKAVGERLTIGSHPSAECVFPDATISRFHCEITLTGGVPRVRDLGSRNGTLLDGVAVEVAPLRDGSVLSLGRTSVRFDLGRKDNKIPLSSGERFGLLVGRSPSMRALFAMLEHAAKNDSTVLLLGETGTGKDRAAESIHQESARKDGPFVVVDCGATTRNLLESELFGHEKGAFTGADRARIGAFEQANGGTIFLDEIGELPLELQPKLLRVLESRKIQRVGGRAPIPTDIRVIAATHRNLRVEVNAHRFRPDLYFRLAVLVMEMPPLRERLDDLPLLIDEILDSLSPTAHPSGQRLRSPEFLENLGSHSWPGNIRELRNHIERALALSRSELPRQEATAASSLTVNPNDAYLAARDRCLRSFDRLYLETLLRAHGGKVREAASAAGIDRAYFYRLMARCGLKE